MSTANNAIAIPNAKKIAMLVNLPTDHILDILQIKVLGLTDRMDPVRLAML